MLGKRALANFTNTYKHLQTLAKTPTIAYKTLSRRIHLTAVCIPNNSETARARDHLDLDLASPHLHALMPEASADLDSQHLHA